MARINKGIGRKTDKQPRLENLDQLFELNDSHNKNNRNNQSNQLNQSELSAPVFLDIERLTPFKGHPFRLYDGERLNSMVESIRANGIIMPVIVRHIANKPNKTNKTYEILSGHNRVEAAKLAGLKNAPVIIRENLSDDEALIIVTETNLIQRSFTDLSHSERAAALSVRNEAIKSQGKRTDLISEIENLLKDDTNSSKSSDNHTCSQVANKPKTTMAAIGQQYGLSKDSVARYLRINKLIIPLKNRLDDGEFGIVPAVDISYLSNEEQESLNAVLNNDTYRLDMKKAELLRESSEFSKSSESSKGSKLTAQIIKDILSGISVKKRKRASLPVQSLKIKGKILSRYFKPEQKPNEIEAEIVDALEFYRAHKNAQ